MMLDTDAHALGLRKDDLLHFGNQVAYRHSSNIEMHGTSKGMKFSQH